MQSLQTLVSSCNSAAIESALLQTFNTAVIKETTLLAGGLSDSAVLKILVDDQYYVLKLDKGTGLAEVPFADCTKVAAGAGIAPPVYYSDRANGITITGFIESKPLQELFKLPGGVVPALAKVIKEIHALPPFPAEKSLVNTVDELIAGFRSSGMLSGLLFDECFACYDVLSSHYPWDDQDKVSSHNDLNPNNIIFDGQKIWIIDWDAAFQNDRYVDLAIAANFYVHNGEQERIFLEAYFDGSVSGEHRARFFLMRQVCYIVYAMMMFRLAEASKPAGTEHDPGMEHISLKETKEKLGSGTISLAGYEGQLLFGKALLIEAVHNMRSERFAASLEALM